MRYLEFEKQIERIDTKISRLNALIDEEGMDLGGELATMKEKLARQTAAVYSKLSPWQRLQVARHEDRPRAMSFMRVLISDFQRLRGDRAFGEDRAIITGMGFFRERRVMVIAQERGHDTQHRIKHNFGMAQPEGYRKVIRCLELADRFSLPVISLIDTPGADPGISSEERGQAHAIATCLQRCLEVRTPFISVIIGEGGSGGAVAIAAGDRVLMLSNAVYSLISPEGCSSILWRDGAHTSDAAQALKITATDLRRLGVIDSEIDEPLGGAHRHPGRTIEVVGDAIYDQLVELEAIPPADRIAIRNEKYLGMGRKGL